MLASREGVHMFSTNANLTLIAQAPPPLYLPGWNFSDLSSSVLPVVHNTCLQAWGAVSTGLLSPARQIYMK